MRLGALLLRARIRFWVRLCLWLSIQCAFSYLFIYSFTRFILLSERPGSDIKKLFFIFIFHLFASKWKMSHRKRRKQSQNWTHTHTTKMRSILKMWYWNRFQICHRQTKMRSYSTLSDKIYSLIFNPSLFDYDCDWTWYPNQLFTFKMKINYTFKNIFILEYEENNTEILWNYFNFCSKATQTSFSANSYLTTTSFYSDTPSNTLT